jgi:hypothetical protein
VVGHVVLSYWLASSGRWARVRVGVGVGSHITIDNSFMIVTDERDGLAACLRRFDGPWATDVSCS